MSVTTLRPNSTVANGSMTLTGSSRHAALSDDSDSTHLAAGIGEFVQLGLTDPSLPAGSVVSLIAVRARTRFNGAGPSGQRLKYDIREIPGGWQTGQTPGLVTWTSPVTHTIPVTATGDGGVLAATLANLRLHLEADGGPSADTLVIYEAFVDVTYVELPAPSVTAPVDESTIEDNTPTVAWDRDLDSDGGAQTHYEVKVFSDGQYGAGGFDPDTSLPTITSGEVAGGSSEWTTTEALSNDTYRAYVRIAQTVNSQQHWSDWATSDFTVDADVPGDPELTLVPEPTMGRMRLDIATTDAPVSTDWVEVERSDDGGEIWATIRTPDGQGRATPESDAVTLYDHESGNGVDASWRVRAVHDYGGGATAAGPWIDATGMWGPTNDQWLKHPSTPTLNMKVTIHAYPPGRRGVRQGRLQPLGRSTIIAISDTRVPREGSVSFLLSDDDERDALDALLDANVRLPLLLQVGATDQRPDRWVIFGDCESEPAVADKAWIAETIETLGWVEVARP